MYASQSAQRACGGGQRPRNALATVLVSPSIIFMCLVHLDSVLCTYRDDGGPGTTFCDQKFDFDEPVITFICDLSVFDPVYL